MTNFQMTNPSILPFFFVSSSPLDANSSFAFILFSFLLYWFLVLWTQAAKHVTALEMTKDSGKLNGGSWECQTTCHFYFESLPSAHDILICWGQQILVLFSSSFFIVFRFMYYYYYYYHACVCNLYKMWENCEQIKK